VKRPHERLLFFATHILNPVVTTFAGRALSPFALLRHIGRRSGKSYDTPLVVRRVAGGFVFTLTYGPDTDWYRNLLAAGRGTLLWHGQEYSLGKPEPLAIETALRTFPPQERFILRLTHIQDFARVPARRAGPSR
jgi:deazaflavin-dependent oxidoreductase (nitroreductase family)